jgi:fluoride exporter
VLLPPMIWVSVLAVGLGAALGALLRWGLSAWLNALWATAPPGTLLANVVGGFGVGVALVYFSQQAGLPEHWRLFVITGFLGGLTTFSTFSAEVMRHLQDGHHASPDGLAAGHGCRAVVRRTLVESLKAWRT